MDEGELSAAGDATDDARRGKTDAGASTASGKTGAAKRTKAAAGKVASKVKDKVKDKVRRKPTATRTDDAGRATKGSRKTKTRKVDKGTTSDAADVPGKATEVAAPSNVPTKTTKKRSKRKKTKADQTSKTGKGDETAPAAPAAKRRRKPLKVGGVRIAPGDDKLIQLNVSEHYTGQALDIPITVIRGRRPGPRLFLTAAVHGDEINGVQIIREVLDQVSADELRGTLVAAPVVNRFGFIQHSRYMPDRRDLNRCFPGSPDGASALRYAHRIFKNIVEPCDYGIDLHTAGYQRHNLPQIRGDMSDPGVKRLAKAFGAEVIMDKKGSKGTLRQVASDHGIPTIIYEAGQTFRFERPAISKGVTGILNVMRELKMLPGEPERPPYQVVTRTSAWLRSGHGGILETYAEAGTLVHKGQAIAAVTEPFGKRRGVVTAPFTGLVVGITLLPMVHPGDPICHMVKLKRSLEKVMRHIGPDFMSVHGPDHPVPEIDDDGEYVAWSAGTPEEDETEG